MCIWRHLPWIRRSWHADSCSASRSRPRSGRSACCASAERWRRAASSGWSSGLGVATADATYGAIAAFGLTAITDLLVDWRRALGIVGGAVPAVACLANVPCRTGRSSDDRRRGAARAARRLPVHARAHPHEPDDDPVVRGAVRGPRDRRRRRRRRRVADDRRVPGLGRVVGRARGRRRGACARGSPASGCAGSTWRRAC